MIVPEPGSTRRRRVAPRRPGTPATATDPTAPPGADPPPVAPFDYTTALLNDPVYQAFLASASAGSVEDAAQRDAAIRRAYIQFGGHPDLGSMFPNATLGPGGPTLLLPGNASPIDAMTQSLADQATASGVSTTARLNAQHDTGVAQVRNALAARGLAHSGEAGVQAQHEATAYGQAQFDATQRFNDYVGGIQAAWVAAERNRELARQQALADAANRQAQYPWNQPTQPNAPISVPPPPPVPVTSPAGQYDARMVGWNTRPPARRRRSVLPSGTQVRHA